MAEIYARLQHITNLDVRTPELLGRDIKRNLILLGGPKANPVTKEFYAAHKKELTFRLDDGVIYDGEQHVIVIPGYIQEATHSIEHLVVDYGLVLYADNPFGSSTKVLHLAGIRGCGTLAAALAVTDDTSLHIIEQWLTTWHAGGCEHSFMEILVKIRARQGTVVRGTLSIEKLIVNHSPKQWSWASTNHQELQPVTPHQLSITLNGSGKKESSVEAITINGQELNCARSPDRRRLLYALAKHSKEDFLAARSETNGWIMPSALAKEMWNINAETGALELSPDLRRVVADSIITWARHLSKKGQLKLDKKICLDHHYVNNNILVFDHDLKKRITDLVYMINHDAKATFGNDFHLIEAQHGCGYRLNVHPALISFTNPGHK
ncbi:MAG: hypothetical protein NPIRA02_13200 [Nitrospirales bacterium]|nr:MAG: hypothetical protein NPIRA02_13200 [Nitrospirales bacterium]